MILKSRSRVQLSPARRTAMQVIAFVENRHERNVYCADYPYSNVFLRFLRDSRRVTLKETRFFSPSLLESEFWRNRQPGLVAPSAFYRSGPAARGISIARLSAGMRPPESSISGRPTDNYLDASAPLIPGEPSCPP